MYIIIPYLDHLPLMLAHFMAAEKDHLPLMLAHFMAAEKLGKW